MTTGKEPRGIPWQYHLSDSYSKINPGEILLWFLDYLSSWTLARDFTMGCFMMTFRAMFFQRPYFISIIITQEYMSLLQIKKICFLFHFLENHWPPLIFFASIWQRYAFWNNFKMFLFKSIIDQRHHKYDYKQKLFYVEDVKSDKRVKWKINAPS